ncbi:MAG: hypothetical protein ACOH2R_28280 [Pseudomonas sp.]
MNRAHPSDLRDAMEAAQSMVKAGVLFVPVPVLSADDAQRIGQMASDRLDQIAAKVAP